VGGGIANTFLAAAGQPIGKSLHEAEMIDTARTLLNARRPRVSKSRCRRRRRREGVLSVGEPT